MFTKNGFCKSAGKCFVGLKAELSDKNSLLQKKNKELENKIYKLQEKYKNAMVNIEKHEALRFKQISRFDKQQRTLGLGIDDVEAISSPYEPLFLKIFVIYMLKSL